MAFALKSPSKLPVVAIVGNPNVGKSVLFNRLTGRYVTVSNYPGTTVEISKGLASAYKVRFIVVDTPGMYSMSPISEDERVARRVLIDNPPDLILHVVDAKNIERMLPLTLQFLEAGFEVIVVANMMDEADRSGIKIDTIELQKRLGIPVIATACLHGRGIDLLKDILYERLAK
ncbi:MAG TPA: FeoB small GTPase domain-containing protein [Fimbriimonadales bacterium]|nr:FeoB small GTPase domain-containing protein [Fimbriimonadales bacterium]